MLEHFKGEEVFVKKVLEYKDQALYKQRLILTSFLDPYHQSIVRSIIGQSDELQVLAFGGFLNNESQRMIIAPDFYEIEKDDFEIIVLQIQYQQKFEKLTHRDVLGAVMSLGIKRELFGDIASQQDGFYIAIEKNLYPYLSANLTTIKHSHVHLHVYTDPVEIQNQYLVKSFIVSSLRLDKIISSFYKIPRTKAADYIRAGYVKVNHKPVEQINYLCNNSDIISFKGHGRVKFVDCHRQTRSNNYVVEGYFYK
ncbi:MULTISPECIES: RNA-binding protein [Coprobacillaceae]|jgi:RNA-binding protein YlmH|uniref:YlmH family RNA-binding protein n=1 Tax=Coprobacillaceae TaxID=2810280 RepID=UPI000E479F89|nr:MULTISPECIES: YlmH/Sll1252 family protein [Coprobacillaceae]RHM62867.1 RNA-binding protein [Coprobacillus sp. AF33-1AC]RHS94992.1 RNA-binding protein [Erysipelatoclostridium sp. AM42-17]